MSECVTYERTGEISIITLNNPSRLNPLSTTLQLRLRELLDRAREERETRALILTGNGKAFCVGADLRDMGPTDAGNLSLGERTANQMHEVSNRVISDLRSMPVPVVAAVNGATAGAGVGIALAADVVLAARSAYFYLPFMTKLGIVPDLGTTWFYERLLGRGRATALTLLGDRLSAEQAERWGLLWACVDDTALQSEALTLARRLAKLPAYAALETRRAYDAAGRNTLEDQLYYEAQRQRELLDQPEFREGVRAFTEKREPRFQPR
jgi:2-(1,2-epoxy-1,2-dihydrophenyl)acetyl-CoA isomerase